MDLTQEVDLLGPAQRVLARWYWVLLATLVGAALGLGLSLLRPAEYQAQAAIAVSLDPTLNGPLELVVEDRALDRVHQLILGDEVLAETSALLLAEDPTNDSWASAAALRQRVRLEQRLARWELTAWDRDPAAAARLANAWAGVAIERLAEAQAHAWRVLEMRGAPFLVECYKRLPESAPDAEFWECITASAVLAPEESRALQAEFAASRGILPSLSFEWVAAAHAPAAPGIGNRGLMVVAGAVLGLIAGVLVSVLVPLRSASPSRARSGGGDPVSD